MQTKNEKKFKQGFNTFSSRDIHLTCELDEYGFRYSSVAYLCPLRHFSTGRKP